MYSQYKTLNSTFQKPRRGDMFIEKHNKKRNEPRRGDMWKKDKSIYRDPFKKIFFVIRNIVFL